jgi:hypothetical protein
MCHFDQLKNRDDGRPAIAAGSVGPAYDKRLDGARLDRQHVRIRDWMLGSGWKTLAEIHQALGYPESSISAQLRHLRKIHCGSYRVEKRRRNGGRGGTWEYKVLPPENPATLSLFDEPIEAPASHG